MHLEEAIAVEEAAAEDLVDLEAVASVEVVPVVAGKLS